MRSGRLWTSWKQRKQNGGYGDGVNFVGNNCERLYHRADRHGVRKERNVTMLAGYKKKKKILDVTRDYVSDRLPQDHYEWRVYWKDLGELLK